MITAIDIGAHFTDQPDGTMPIALVTDAGVVLTSAEVSMEEGTFMAKSQDRRGRGIAAAMAVFSAQMDYLHA